MGVLPGKPVWLQCASVSHKPQFLIHVHHLIHLLSPFFPTFPHPAGFPRMKSEPPSLPGDWTTATLALQGPLEHLGKDWGGSSSVWLTCMGMTLSVSGLSSQLGPWLWNREHHL